MDNKLEQIKNYLETLDNYSNDTLKFTVTLQIPKTFDLNLFFRKEHEKEIYVKEFLLRKKFLPYYPHTLKIKDYEILKKDYKPYEILILFTISKEEYINHLHDKFKIYFLE